MQYIKGIENYTETARSAVTLGKFDGLHRGHRKLIEQIMRHANEECGLKSVVCFFDMTKFKEQLGLPTKKLMTNMERALRLQSKVDYLVECPLEDVKDMEPEAFIEQVLVQTFHVKYVVVGWDYHFGHDRRGDIALLKKYEEKYGYTVDVLEKETYYGRRVSSTYVKEVMTTGNMYLVNKLLSHPYTVAGYVRHGRKIGRRIGSPTMNIVPIPEKLLPPNGVYICEAKVKDIRYHGVCYIGVKPTLQEENTVVLDAHLFDYPKHQTVYGKEIEVQLYRLIRLEKAYDSLEELQRQIQLDILFGKEYFKEMTKETH